jgi:hypothetical protein
MRNRFTPLLLVLAGWSAAAQPKISPRIANAIGSVYVVQFRDGSDMAGARLWLAGNGFDVLEHPDLRPTHLLAAGPRGRLPDIVRDDAVAYILPASPELSGRQRVIACAGPITANEASAPYVQVGRGWPKDTSGNVTVRYVVQSLTGKLEENAARGELERAFREWQTYGNLTLMPGDAPDAPRTIAIQFARREHDDGLPFDGPGGTLAHTYYPAPPNPEPIAGNMHLDADEEWRIGAGIDLYTVALHEAGHALGLGHSDQPGAVMYPYYRLAYGLTSDDIAGLQDLYGAPSGAAPAPAPAPIPVPAPPSASPVPPSPAQPPSPVPSADRTPPTLRISSPATTMLPITAANVLVSGTASDDTGVVVVKWSTSSGDAGTAAGTASWSAAIPLYVGNTTVTVRAYDAAGNSGWRAVTLTRK